MEKNKTTQTNVSVNDFINAIDDPIKQEDSFKIIELIKKITGFDAKMWGPSIIGFGNYHYKYESGHEGDMPVAGFSPRKGAIVFYFCIDFEKKEELLQRFGKHTRGKSCIYIKKLADIKIPVLKEMIQISVKYIRDKYPP